MHYKKIIIPNKKVPVVKMIPLIEAAEGRGRGAMVTPTPEGLKV